MIVVTGASGLIGSNIVRELYRRGHDHVVCCDSLIRDNVRDEVGDDDSFVHKDALLDWLYERAPEVEAVIHMGACTDTTETNRELMMQDNLEYTRRLWTFCGLYNTRFVYASSAATYGALEECDDTVDIDTLSPLNLYAESKHKFDTYVKAVLAMGCSVGRPTEWAGLKFFNVYGPGEDHKGKMASMAFHSYYQILRSGKVKLFESKRPGCANGEQKRDFVFVDDVVSVVLHFALGNIRSGLYNVGTGKPRSFNDLARAVFKAMGRDEEIEYIPMPTDLEGKYQYRTRATMGKLRKAGGYKQKFADIEDGIREYVGQLRNR